MRIRLLITIAISILVGFVSAVWRYKLDPPGTGASILAFPVILSLLFINLTLFVSGLVLALLRNPLAPSVAVAPLFIWISFLVLNAFIDAQFSPIG